MRRQQARKMGIDFGWWQGCAEFVILGGALLTLAILALTCGT